MDIKTEQGIAKPMPLSDIQENNRLLKKLINLGAVCFGSGFLYLLWLTYYIIKNNVVNNIVASCV